MDERSNIRLKNETKITRVRNTMAPSTSSISAHSLGGSLNNNNNNNAHLSYQRVGGMPSSSGLMAPSKTPTLYETKKRSQPFLNSDHQKNLHIYRQNESSNTTSVKKYASSIYNAAPAAENTTNYNRSRTALQ